MADSKINMYEHSEAKVSLYGKYLSIYLNVLSRVSYVDDIFIFDLFCGEGIYENGGKGSPIITIENIKNHYFSNNKSCPNLYVTLNDDRKSEIESSKLKIERVKENIDKLFIPDNVKVGYTKLKYEDLITAVINRTNKLKNNQRALLFIDPWGYKEIKPMELRALLENGKTEIILFLPIYFMSRFTNKSVHTSEAKYPGGNALRKFLAELYGTLNNVPIIKNQQQFIYEIQEQFKKYLGLRYVDSFRIERDKNQWFALYFFTNSMQGFHKMLDAKWSIDKKHGSSFKKGADVSMEFFDEIKLSKYDEKVEGLLRSRNDVTNMDLLEFGLENNFLPKHTKKVLDNIKKNFPLKVVSLDGKPALSYYIGNKKRTVNIKLN